MDGVVIGLSYKIRLYKQIVQKLLQHIILSDSDKVFLEKEGILTDVAQLVAGGKAEMIK